MKNLGVSEFTMGEGDGLFSDPSPVWNLRSQDASVDFELPDRVSSTSQWTYTCTSRGQKFRFRSSLYPKPIWFDSLARGLVDVLTLPSDWDSDGGNPIDLKVVKLALEFAPLVLESQSPPPWVVPMSDGGIQFEWHKGDAELELVIDPDRVITGYWFCESTEEEEEFEIGADLALIKSYIAQIS